MKTILVTGGAGYIGSHTLIELINNNFEVVVIDNLANSSRESLRRVEQITGHDIPFIEADVRDQSALDDIFTTYDIDSVIHFAGLKAVGESVAKPLEYYDNNLVSTMVLLEVMREHNVKQLVFSSSATVYGSPSELPLRETSTVGVGLTNPYGKTKYMIEQIIQDYCAADPTFEATILRYFNPIGAHQSGQIGEDPNGIPNNLLPYVAQVAVGKLQSVGVFGDDYDTPDGTGVRDYIHVVDLARGHVAALQHMKAGANVYNLGTGSGTSVLEIIKAFSKACGRDLPYEIKPRRAGDIAACYADCSKAERELGWRAELSIEQACADSWRWQSQNPNGFSE
ncbi:UDP-glucose 4-epimerase GalE [Candidatus Nanosynsacchari sp. TM7_ANC_38.39_G1_1]|uniref:UDP-glucose 4-epimerase GalE n=1 Tax=Candidatus Nanosynsacchari sp. TM7_ANC_38.39_G1_1 TaxID=1986206 RepID=UPI00101C5390|nr:UDP-glucose 4-epimerase GalE [Candidatus Nanosynsacchari sp. TM7_ANC_38.39_G1_1]RYC73498.1 UDP-glucose 4-epimerase [Candidatus Nanosynsacchari sp. TM7_ANC_38.39_G1_1]